MLHRTRIWDVRPSTRLTTWSVLGGQSRLCSSPPSLQAQPRWGCTANDLHGCASRPARERDPARTRYCPTGRRPASPARAIDASRPMNHGPPENYLDAMHLNIHSPVLPEEVGGRGGRQWGVLSTDHHLVVHRLPLLSLSPSLSPFPALPTGLEAAIPPFLSLLDVPPVGRWR